MRLNGGLTLVLVGISLEIEIVSRLPISGDGFMMYISNSSSPKVAAKGPIELKFTFSNFYFKDCVACCGYS